MLQFDYTQMMADVVGSKLGVVPSELEQAVDRVRAIHVSLQDARESGDLPFYDLPFQTGVDDLIEMADGIASRFDAFVVLGIGGSALGTTAVARALLPLYATSSRPRLFVLDNVDPDGVGGLLDSLDPTRTCFCVISKSGTTVETMSQFLIAREWVRNACGDNYRDHFVLITDPETGVLRKLAEEEGYENLAVPAGVGGRFSIFTPVGLLPLAVAGVDVRSLLAGAAKVEPQISNPDLFENPAYLNGLLQYLSYQKGATISVMMPYSDRLRDVADWYRQLWAESLGKRVSLSGEEIFTGPTPVNALGATDQHSQLQLYMEGPFDKVVTFITVDNQKPVSIPNADDIPDLAYLGGKKLSALLSFEQKASAIALARAGRPNCTIRLAEITPQSIGALLYIFEVQTVFSGGLFGVDPLDQPGVEAGKIITSALMGRSGFDKERQEIIDWERRADPKVLHVI